MTAYGYREMLPGPFLAQGGHRDDPGRYPWDRGLDGAMGDEYWDQEQADALAVINSIPGSHGATARWGCEAFPTARSLPRGRREGAPRLGRDCFDLRHRTALPGMTSSLYKGGCLIKTSSSGRWNGRSSCARHRTRRSWARRAGVLCRRQRLDATSPLTILWNKHQTLDDK